MTAKLEPRRLMRDGQASVTWFVRLPAGTSHADILRPNFWAAVVESVSANDLVRCQAPDLTFDLMFVVVARATGGLKLREWPVRPAATERAFEHVEGSAIVLKLKTEDPQQGKHTQELVVMPEVALALARALLAALVRMGHAFGDEES